MSGGEPSSIKRRPACAARLPALSRFPAYRVYHTCQRQVRGSILRRAVVAEVTLPRLRMLAKAQSLTSLLLSPAGSGPPGIPNDVAEPARPRGSSDAAGVRFTPQSRGVLLLSKHGPLRRIRVLNQDKRIFRFLNLLKPGIPGFLDIAGWFGVSGALQEVQAAEV